MSNFVKLPSGGGVNVDNISAWNKPIRSGNVITKELDDALLVIFTDEADGATWR